jgi:hypothetical protein
MLSRETDEPSDKDSRPRIFWIEALRMSFHHPDRKALCVTQ